MPSCVPIPSVTATVTIGNSIHERQQIPSKLAWALTIHKSQGMTLKKAWVDIGKGEKTSLVIKPVTYDRILSIKKSELLKYRLKEEERLHKLSEHTTANKFVFQ